MQVADTLDTLIEAFLRDGPAAQCGSAVQETGRFLSAGDLIARRLSPAEVWIQPRPLGPVSGKHRARVRRAALMAGFRLYEGAKPPAEADDNFAPIPPVSREDATLVVSALRRYANGAAPGLPDASVAERCRRLADVYEAASKGNRTLAAGLYGALQPSPKVTT